MPSPLFPLGGVYIDSSVNEVRFSTDPATYETLNWQKRYSINMAIGGLVTIQDFGTFMKDNTLKLGSGAAQFLDEATVIALHTRFRTRGAVYNFRDYLNNQFVVFIKEFVPTIFKRGLYHYTMELQVTSITQLWGVVFTGA